LHAHAYISCLVGRLEAGRCIGPAMALPGPIVQDMGLLSRAVEQSFAVHMGGAQGLSLKVGMTLCSKRLFVSRMRTGISTERGH
jgi:hypothetical protein